MGLQAVESQERDSGAVPIKLPAPKAIGIVRLRIIGCRDWILKASRSIKPRQSTKVEADWNWLLVIVLEGAKVVVIVFPSPHFKSGICHRIVWKGFGDACRCRQPATRLVVDGKQDMALNIFESAGVACINDNGASKNPDDITC